jgi:RNA polymerase I-specific transcription initiation factor RRN3
MTASDPDLAKQLFRANVKLAIDERGKGNFAKYDELRGKFTSRDTSAIELCQYLAALTHFVTYAPLRSFWQVVDDSRLEAPMYTSLVRAILSLDWVVFPPSLLKIYISFIATLSTAQTTYVPLILSHLLREFVYTTPPPTSETTRTILQENAHFAIRELLDVVPASHTMLLRLVREGFPHKSAERREQVSYVYNLFKICSYAGHLTGDILSLCVERVVQVDVPTRPPRSPNPLAPPDFPSFVVGLDTG